MFGNKTLRYCFNLLIALRIIVIVGNSSVSHQCFSVTFSGARIEIPTESLTLRSIVVRLMQFMAELSCECETKMYDQLYITERFDHELFAL